MWVFCEWANKIKAQNFVPQQDDYLYCILLFKGLSLFGILIFFLFKNIPTPLCFSNDKIKRQFGKNTTLASTKTLPKK